jgi:diacylglycerol O-acyltransferase
MDERIERLSLLDLTNLAAEAADTPMHVGALGILDAEPLLGSGGRLDMEMIRSRIDGRLQRVPDLRRVLWRTGPFQGRPLWVDDPGFRVENHVLRADLPVPGGEEQAMRFAEGMMTALMDRSRPLWQLWFLEGYGPGKVGVFLKLHHVLADGNAVLNMISLLFDLEPGVVDEATAAWSPARPPSAWQLIRDNVQRKRDALAGAALRLAHPAVLARTAAHSIRAVWEAIIEGFGAPRTSINRPIGPSRHVAVMRMSLKEVKEAAHAQGVKVNDVLLDMIAGGLREVLLARGERVDGVSIRASMAISQPTTDRSATVGNRAGSVIVPLPLDEADARVRMGTIAAASTRAKSSQRGAVPQLVMVLLAATGLTRSFIRRQHLINFLVTNLAGPAFPLYVAGARMLDAFTITPVAGNVTASFAALSYDGHLDLSVHVDAACWPDLDVLMRGMDASWRMLELATAA